MRLERATRLEYSPFGRHALFTMILSVLAFLGGVLTIFSPCILPVLPFVLARADQPFLKSGLPLLLGMALAFTGVASLAAVGGGWAIEVNHYGRLLAMGLLAFFALTLLLPGFAERLARPVVALGARLSLQADSRVTGGSFVLSMAVGVATGFLWAPCAGPVLGLVLTAAAIRGPGVGTSWLLLTYAAGAATSMALALLLGRRVHAFVQRSLAVSRWARRAVGVMVLAGVAMIAAGLDTGLLSQLSLAGTTSAEQKLIDTLKPQGGMPGKNTLALSASGQDAPVLTAPARRVENSVTSVVKSEGQLPPLDGATGWLNSAPLSSEALRGKVVLVDFWTYSCINCLRTLPYIRAWAEKYRDAGLVVVGVHSPEFAFEKDQDNVRRAVKDLGITYPVAIDSRHAIWRAFGNQYWPALYFVDAQGRIRHHVFGEGQYAESERMIQKLLAENGTSSVPVGLAQVDAHGVQAAPGERALSGEAYLGASRAESFVSAGGLRAGRPHLYPPAEKLKLNQWALEGHWTVEADRAVTAAPGARLAYRFYARDLHLVLGRDASGKPVRFRVRIDGKPPSGNHGTDVDADGNGVVDAHRLYQLVRQENSSGGDHLFEIEFLDTGAYAYAFTFG